MSRHVLFALLLMRLAAPTFAADAQKARILCLCGLTQPSLYMADADGRNERPFLPDGSPRYNASFSANGQWIIFTSERSGKAEIYRAHPDGSGVEWLTENTAFDDQGVLSPDGRTLAFVSTREGGRANVWLLDLQSRRTVDLTKGHGGNFRPSWSPDGKWIAFTSDRDTHPGRATPKWELLQLAAVYIVHPDGTGLRRLTSLNEFSGSPKWSPDGRRIVFYKVPNIRGRHTEQPGLPAMPQIVSIDVATGEEQVHTAGYEEHLSPQYINADTIGYSTYARGKLAVASTADSNGFSIGESGLDSAFPSWSPDGSSVIFERNSATEGSQWMKPFFSQDSRYTLLQSNAFGFPAISPDGRYVATPDSNKLQIIDPDGTHARNLFVATEPNKQVLSVSWSRNGQLIAFDIGRFSRVPAAAAQVAVIKPDGSDLRVVTQGADNSAFPSLSPDGRRIVFRVLGSQQGLRILDLQSGAIMTLTKDWDNFPAWSPKGDQIVFTSLRTGDFEIFTIRPDGSGLRQLTRDHGNDGHPTWSPDGRWIAFASSRAGWKDEGMYGGGQPYGEIVVMRADGSDARPLTDNQWEEAPQGWFPSTN